MNFSEYFLLAAATILVVSAQQPNPESANALSQFFEYELGSVERSRRAQDTIDIIKQSSQENQDALVFCDATLVLRNGYINGTKYISAAENIIFKDILAFEKSILEDTECVKKSIQQAFPDARAEIYKAARPFFQSFGEAVTMSNDRTKRGLGIASVLIQRAGSSILDALNVAERLFNAGIDTGGDSGPVLLKTIRLTIEIGFSGIFNKIQESIRVANQALRDAQFIPMHGQIEELHCDCAAAANDPEGANAIKEINKASNSALQRGANPQLVQQLRGVMICVLGDFVNIIGQGKQTLQNLETMAENVSLSAIRKASFKQAEDIKQVIHSIAANIYLILGDIALKSGNPLKDEIVGAIEVIEQCKTDAYLGIETAEDLIVIGLRYGGVAPIFAIEAASQSQLFGKIAFIQRIVKSAKLVLSVL